MTRATQILSNINNKEINSKAILCKKGFFYWSYKE